jgi:hypothetical protein
MSSTQHPAHGNDDRAKDSTTTNPSKVPCGVVLETDFTVAVDQELIEDQELEESYIFVDADYHSYTDVESSVAGGSSTDCELSERGDEVEVDSKRKADKMEHQNGGVKMVCVKKTMKKETSTVNSSIGKDGMGDISHKGNVGHEHTSSNPCTNGYRLRGHRTLSQSIRLVLRDLAGRYGGKGPARETHSRKSSSSGMEDMKGYGPACIVSCTLYTIVSTGPGMTYRHCIGGQFTE